MYTFKLLIVPAFLVNVCTAIAQDANAPQKPSITFKGLIQPRFESSLTDSVDVNGKVTPTPLTNNFRVRRAELEAIFNLNTHWSGDIRIQFPELKLTGNTPTPGRAIELAYLTYTHNDQLNIRAGQMKMPYELDELTPYEDLRMIDRGTTNTLYALPGNSLVSYQPGFMVFGTFMKAKTPLSYYAGIFNASDRSLSFDVNSEKNIIGRVEYTPIRGLRLAGNAQYVSVSKGANGVSAGGDLSFIRDLNNRLNLTLEGEYISAPNVNLYTIDTSKTKALDHFTMTGYFGQALLKIKTNFKLFEVFEVGGKYENTDPHTQLDDNSTLAFHTITGDIGFDFLPNNQARLQLNVIRTIYDHTTAALKSNTMFVMQMQLKIG